MALCLFSYFVHQLILEQLSEQNILNLSKFRSYKPLKCRYAYK